MFSGGGAGTRDQEVEGAERGGGERWNRGRGESAGDGCGDVEGPEVGCCGEDKVERVDLDTSVGEVESAEVFAG